MTAAPSHLPVTPGKHYTPVLQVQPVVKVRVTTSSSTTSTVTSSEYYQPTRTPGPKMILQSVEAPLAGNGSPGCPHPRRSLIRVCIFYSKFPTDPESHCTYY